MHINQRKAQIALEYLFLLGIVLVVLFFLIGKGIYERASGDSRIIVAQRSVDVLAKTADDVYKLGQGNVKCVPIEIPKGVADFKVHNGDVIMKVIVSGEVTDVVGRSELQKTLYGVIPVNPGRYKICIDQRGDFAGLISLSGATCSSGDGCIPLCGPSDPDCTDYNSGYAPGLYFGESSYYCGNGVLESGEECELNTTCDDTLNPGKVCNMNKCLCELRSGDTPTPTWCGDTIVQRPNSKGQNEECELDSQCTKRSGGSCTVPPCTCAYPAGSEKSVGENPGDNEGLPSFGGPSSGGSGPSGPITGAPPVYWKDPLTPKDGRYCKSTAIPMGVGDPNQYCSAIDDCPPNEVCKASGSSCTCAGTGIATYGNSVWEPGENCDTTAGNPTAQCRYSLGDVTNTQYMCNAGTCQALAAGSAYLGDGIVQVPNMQGILEQCDPPFDYDQQSGMTCNLLGQLVMDSDGDGLGDNEENNHIYRHGKTNPTMWDTDGDTLSDGAEILAGFYPNAHNDIDSIGIVSNNGILNNPEYPNVYVEQCDRSSQQYNNNYCQQEFSLTKCSDINSHCVDMDKPQ